MKAKLNPIFHLLRFTVITACLVCAIAFMIPSEGKASAADAADAATGTAATEIYTVEDLLKIADNPSGNYVLKSDLDLSGVAWPAITFTGTFDGEGHILLNLTNPAVSEETRVTYDGNRKTYDTVFCGLFAILEHAEVKNVRLLGINSVTNIEKDCFCGGIAGFASESTIENCELSGTIRLSVSAKMFGVGGIIGYGNGVIRGCKADVTLINTDTDAAHRDEEFLGGVCAAGYPDIDGCTISLKGYLSDHGYVHSGGLVGMYIVYPKRFQRNGFIKNNVLDGFITFFEHNTDRRAYCAKQCGEIMDWMFTDSGNTYHFTRDERKTYDVELLPHGDCKEPAYDDTVIPPTCTEPGKTLHLCKSCGFSCFDSYVLPTHTLSEEYTVVVESTLTEQGTGEFTCKDCGATIRSALPTLTPAPTPTPTLTPTPVPTDPAGDASANSDDTGNGNASEEGGFSRFLLPGAIVLLIVTAVLLSIRAFIHGKALRRRRSR